MDTKLFMIHGLEIQNYLQKNLFDNPRYKDGDRMPIYEKQVFSQFGEDGIIKEIFRRIGTTNKYFVEFGVETGVETNTTYLLYQDWKGLWIDGSEANAAVIHSLFPKAIAKKQLNVIRSFITAENIESLFAQGEVPVEFDLLSIDIDRNDYYIWQAIQHYNPRVVIIEYNSIFLPGDHFVVDYDANAMWDRSSNFGASLTALEKLGESKGYKLVGSSFAGLNAFFVRDDIASKHFTGPFTAENHYEEPRYFLYTKNGHPRKVSL
ncbi:MAG: hypothetical protein ABIS69_04135 [Sediminibacterium sp.]